VIILGISAFYHDSAACLLIDGEIRSAAQEERFTRIKHDADFPRHAINSVLESENISVKDIDFVVFYDKPLLKFERLLESYVATAPKGLKSFNMAIPVWLKDKLFLKDQIFKHFRNLNSNFSTKQILFAEHHLSHAASAFYPSPFENAAILTIDGVGEWATTTICHGNKNKLDIEKEIHFPHSLGLLYSAFTQYTGFRVNSGEYKLMGLAPYGEPIYKDLILDNLIDIKDDGSFRLNQSYFNYVSGLEMINQKFISLFGEPIRKPDYDELSLFHMNIASSIQAVTEEIILKMVKNMSEIYQTENLCLAGGVALNCVVNGKIQKSGFFDNIWIQPAAGDAGGSLGAALLAYHSEFNSPRMIYQNDSMNGSYLGSKYNDSQIKNSLDSLGAIYEKYDRKSMISETAKHISNNKAVGWFQGRMEFGPRALGNRSILGNPKSMETQKTINMKVKFRESFRPFAPSICEEDSQEWFDIDCISPYMLLVCNVNDKKLRKLSDFEIQKKGLKKLHVKRSEIPAVTHVDSSSRLHTVSKETNPLFHSLLSEFKKKTDCPVLVNTSFNVRGEPLVQSPKDAFNCFMGTDLDVLVIGNYILEKNKQVCDINAAHKDKFSLD